jgi:hypothetical protein
LNRRQHARESRLGSKRKVVRENRRKVDVAAGIRTALLLVLIAQCLRVAFASPRLQVQVVDLTGTERLSPADVVQRGGIRLGQNIFAVNLTRVRQALKADPVIEDAVVTRDLPNRLSVTVRERVPALRIVGSRAAFHADREGVVFQRARFEANKLPVLEMADRRLPKPGEALPADWVEAVWQCVELARKERVDVLKMRIDGAGELWLNVSTGPTSQAAVNSLSVRVGRTTDLPEKFRDIRRSLAGWPNLTASARYLNVMSAGNPAYMKAPEQTATN